MGKTLFTNRLFKLRSGKEIHVFVPIDKGHYMIPTFWGGKSLKITIHLVFVWFPQYGFIVDFIPHWRYTHLPLFAHAWSRSSFSSCPPNAHVLLGAMFHHVSGFAKRLSERTSHGLVINASWVNDDNKKPCALQWRKSKQKIGFQLPSWKKFFRNNPQIWQDSSTFGG